MTTVLVAGSGPLAQKEADDLLNDFFGDDNNVTLVAPGDSRRLNKSVLAVTDGFPWLEVFYVIPDGDTRARKVPPDAEVVEGPILLDVLEDEDEEVDLLLIAVPEEDGAEYEEIVALVDAAVDRGIPVKDLTSGLDDVRLEDADTPVVEAVCEPLEGFVNNQPKEPVPVADTLVVADEEEDPRMLKLTEAIESINRARECLRILLGKEISPPMAEQETAPEGPRKRGRPRTNVGEKLILRDDAWVPRPRGRVKKGTPTRVVHIDTGEVLEEGVEGE